MEYKYKAFYENQLVEGIIEGESKLDAINKLKIQDMIILELEEIEIYRKKINYEFLEQFTKQLLQLLKSGLTIDRSIVFLSKTDKKYSSELSNILNDLRSGVAFSTAIKNSGLFPMSYAEMIKSGEESGNLEETLELLLNTLHERNEFKKNLINAIIYPSFLFCISVISFLVISMYVIPKFKVILQSVDVNLPLITKLAFFISDIFSFILIGSLFVLLFSLIYIRMLMKSNKEGIERFLLKIPMFGQFLLKIELIRFSQSMYSLLRSSIPLNRAIDIAVGTVNMSIIKQELNTIKGEVIKGSSLSVSMRKSNLIPQILVEIIAVGEQSGELAGAFYQIYTHLNEDFKNSIRRFISLLEPSIIVLMGLIIGFLVFSMMLAVFSISSGI
jgi:type II secretory pathway component PulF